MKPMKSGGGWAAIKYTLRQANRVGWWRLWKAMSARNTCKTCALGMGGQKGGMVNEAGHWPEVCKKSLQAMVADMQQGLRPEFFGKYGFAELRTLSPRDLEWCGRIVEPLYAGPDDTHYRPLSWDDALSKITEQLKQTPPDGSFFYASGRSSNEAGFLLQLFARVYGSNFVHNCSFYCHQASGVGMAQALGTSTATLTLDDVEKSDLFFLIGGNPASNHPRLMRSLMMIRRRGGQVIVINPVKELGLVNFRVPSDVRSLLFGSEIASLYIQPHIGGDMALLSGIAKRVIEKGGADAAFIAEATEGYDDYRQAIEALSWDAIVQGCGVERAIIERAGDLYLASKNAVFGWTMGITHHAHGVANVRTVANLALLRGMVGKPHSGMLPIRGHSNVQGIGSMGVSPALKQAVLDKLEIHLNIKLPSTPGLDTMACMEAADRGQIRTALCLGGNLFGSNPDSRFAAQAIGKIGLVAYMNTTLNTGHAWGRGRETLILPVLARDEECQTTTQESMFNYVRLSDGGVARHVGPRSEVDLLTTLGQLLFGERSPVDWKGLREHKNIRRMIGHVIPGYEKIARIDETKEEFPVKGRAMHESRFGTKSRKAQFQAFPLPAPREENQLRLMTCRSEGQFNTVVYEEEDIYRAQDGRDVILLSQADIDRLGLKVEQRIIVRSEVGAMRGIRVRAYDIRPGNALMYYPEANVLVPKTVDPQSKTPAFKSVPITLEVETGLNGNHPAEERRQPLELVR